MKIDTDKLVGLSALVIGVCTVIITMYQTQLMREQAHASVMPYLAIAIRSNSDGAYLMLYNTGVGPALINNVTVHHDGKDFAGDPYLYFMAQRADVDADNIQVDRVTPGRLIPAGASIQMVGSDKIDRNVMLKDLLQTFELIDVPKQWLEMFGATTIPKGVVEISYSSVYGERWRVMSNQNIPAIP